MYIAAAPSYAAGDTCAVCGATLPLHQAECPYRHSLDDSFDTMAGIAAPLLAGFSIAFIGLVISSAGTLRWPAWTLLLLVASALVLILAVQAGFWARAYRPDVSAEQADRWSLLLPRYARWTLATRWAYNAGISLLLLGIACALYPKPDAGQFRWRVAAAALTAVSAVSEVGWAALTHRSPLGRRDS